MLFGSRSRAAQLTSVALNDNQFTGPLSRIGSLDEAIQLGVLDLRNNDLVVECCDKQNSNESLPNLFLPPAVRMLLLDGNKMSGVLIWIASGVAW